MKIYVSHSRSFDYKNELYRPIRESTLNNEHEFVLPHEHSDELFNSRETMKTFDLVLAEVTYPKIGVGIELGWADAFNIPIIALHKTGTEASTSAVAVAQQVLEYSSSEELIETIRNAISK